MLFNDLKDFESTLCVSMFLMSFMYNYVHLFFFTDIHQFHGFWCPWTSPDKSGQVPDKLLFFQRFP